jgi:hypothetical protein
MEMERRGEERRGETCSVRNVAVKTDRCVTCIGPKESWASSFLKASQVQLLW